MATPTYTPIASYVASGTESGVDFTGISGFRDLILVIDGNTNTTSTTVDLLLNINGSTSSFSRVVMFNTGSGTGSNSIVARINPTNVASSLHVIQALDFDQTDKHKTILTRSNRVAQSNVDAQAMRWANTTAGTSIGVGISSTFKSGSTFALYGIEA